MLEINDLVLLGIVSSVISAIIGIIIALIARSIRDRDVERLYKMVESLEMSIKGQIGNQRKAEQNERLEQAMGEAALIMQNKEMPDKKEALIQLGLKYPDIAMKLMKKYAGL